MRFFRKRYRVVTDKYNGYEVQFRYWFCPIWFQQDGVNTYTSLDEAIKKARPSEVVWRDNIKIG